MNHLVKINLALTLLLLLGCAGGGGSAPTPPEPPAPAPSPEPPPPEPEPPPPPPPAPVVSSQVQAKMDCAFASTVCGSDIFRLHFGQPVVSYGVDGASEVLRAWQAAGSMATIPLTILDLSANHRTGAPSDHGLAVLQVAHDWFPDATGIYMTNPIHRDAHQLFRNPSDSNGISTLGRKEIYSRSVTIINSNGNQVEKVGLTPNKVLVRSAGNEGPDDYLGAQSSVDFGFLDTRRFINVVGLAPDGQGLAPPDPAMDRLGSSICSSLQTDTGIRAMDYCLAAPFDVFIWEDGFFDADGNEVPTGSEAVFKFSGTSASAPTVAGGMALIWNLFPDLTPENLVQLTLECAEDIGAPGIDEVTGRGRFSLTCMINPDTDQIRLPDDYRVSAANVTFATAVRAYGARIGSASATDSYGRHYSLSLRELRANSQAMTFATGLTGYLGGLATDRAMRYQDAGRWRHYSFTGVGASGVLAKPITNAPLLGAASVFSHWGYKDRLLVGVHTYQPLAGKHLSLATMIGVESGADGAPDLWVQDKAACLTPFAGVAVTKRMNTLAVSLASSVTQSICAGLSARSASLRGSIVARTFNTGIVEFAINHSTGTSGKLQIAGHRFKLYPRQDTRMELILRFPL